MRRRAILLMGTMGAAVLLVSGVALALNIINCSSDPCFGTNKVDSINGTSNSETIYAKDGNDGIVAQPGNDIVYGGRGRDIIEGAGGDDTIYGGPNADNLRGEENSDTVYGGGGPDTIDAVTFDTAGSTDYSYGEGDNDTIRANDSKVDIIDCGGGSADTVFYDTDIDTITNCEIENPPS
jgi:Ca2+-binding RTX toxin-like protein